MRGCGYRKCYTFTMKLLLTSAGLTNKTIISGLKRLLGKGLKGAKVAFIPTAANVEEGSKDWLIGDYNNCQNTGLEVDIVDISAVKKDVWLPRLQAADIILLGGGNTFHLMYWVEKSGLRELLPDLLSSKVYIGISAGSCICGPTVYNSVQNLFKEKYELKIEKGLGLVDFQFIPHLNSEYFTLIRKDNLEKKAKELSEPVYGLDDNSAILIHDDKIEILSEGEWMKFN